MKPGINQKAGPHSKYSFEDDIENKVFSLVLRMTGRIGGSGHFMEMHSSFGYSTGVVEPLKRCVYSPSYINNKFYCSKGIYGEIIIYRMHGRIVGDVQVLKEVTGENNDLNIYVVAMEYSKHTSIVL